LGKETLLGSRTSFGSVWRVAVNFPIPLVPQFVVMLMPGIKDVTPQAFDLDKEKWVLSCGFAKEYVMRV
jgi:hypothetical protein